MDDEAWFAPRRYGLGAGWPIRWQGWLLTVLAVGVGYGAGVLLVPGHRLAFAAVIAVDAVVFGWMAKRRTRGGWRWRWGGAD